jgi:putative pre-16S rRNA nuclease
VATRGDAVVVRLAGVDYGGKRIGLSVSDPDGIVASPFKMVVAQGGVMNQVESILRAVDEEFDVREWVVGYPLNMDGTAGPQAEISAKFAARLRERSGMAVHLWDERLSTAQANLHMSGTGLTNKKKKVRRDMLAAQIILQSFLDARRSE